MGKSTTSCFKIISCAGQSTNDDDLPVAESKGTLEKRRWSFGKKSARHQVPSSTVILEPQSVSCYKENPENTANDFYSVKDSSVPEKSPIIEQTKETPSLSSAEVTSDTADALPLNKIATTTDFKLEEYVAVAIQSAIRVYLAQRELRKLKNVVKLQAAVRGHLVRRQAVGTLRCVQAIVKMQALIRSRRAHQSVEKFATKEKIHIDFQQSSPIVKGDADIGPNKTKFSIEKLLSNGFAQRLLETTPKTKPIHISVDPLRPNSAWNWLERWMAVSSSKVGQHQELNLNHSYQVEEEDNNPAPSEAVDVVSAIAPMSSDSDLPPCESAVQTEGEGNLITDHSGKIEFQAPISIPNQCFSSLAEDEQEHSQCEEALGTKQENFTETGRIKETPDSISVQLPMQSGAVSQSGQDNMSNKAEFVMETLKCTTEKEAFETGRIEETSDSISSQLPMQSGSDSQSEHDSMSNKPEFLMETLNCTTEEACETGGIKETSDVISSQLPMQSGAVAQSVHDNMSKKPEFVMETLKCTTDKEACEPIETEGKKFLPGLKKVSSPAFAAVQAKFEELSSAPKVSKSISNAYRDAADESGVDRSQVDSMTKIKELSLIENSTTHNPTVQVAASECGTEISISSTLDSPDRSEADGGEIVLEIGMSKERNHDVSSGASNAFNIGKMSSEAKNSSSDSDSSKLQKLEESDGNVASLIAAVDSVQVYQQPTEATISGNHIQLEDMKDPHAYNSSPEGSPRGRVTAPESHGTPSSQVSLHSKTSKTESKTPARKKTSKLVDKSSPSYQKNASGASSTEHLPNDAKNAKRRNSFGMVKPDHADHDLRISSSNSLPSYMQATESARAKVHGSISLKSSPDVHDKDNYMKKRHAVPPGDEKQGSSPRVQKPTSQAKQNVKENNNHSTNNSAERRWQR